MGSPVSGVLPEVFLQLSNGFRRRAGFQALDGGVQGVTLA